MKTSTAVKTSASVEASATAGFRRACSDRAGQGNRHDGNCHRQFVGHGTLHLNHNVRFHLGQTFRYACTKLTTMRGNQISVLLESRVFAGSLPLERIIVGCHRPCCEFGFITPDTGVGDVFEHSRALEMSGIETLRAGNRGEYERAPDRCGWQAYLPKHERPSLTLLASA
ncbi:MAG TPA: cold shock domain-containing protein [Acetobacteraceae bacterium]|nr:cold shock domain-containing protein [Acetobacteraceae bacterium]